MGHYDCRTCGQHPGACVCGDSLNTPAAEEPKKANERQVGGDHYKTLTGRQHWDVVVEFGLDYFQGQITKYLFRWAQKGGIQDLKKARHFLDKYIEVAERDAKIGEALGVKEKT